MKRRTLTHRRDSRFSRGQTRRGSRHDTCVSGRSTFELWTRQWRSWHGSTAFSSLGVHFYRDSLASGTEREKIFVFGAGGHAKVLGDSLKRERRPQHRAGLRRRYGQAMP
jgi:hypothetical protein